MSMMPYHDISAIQLLCWGNEVASSGASHIVAMELADDICTWLTAWRRARVRCSVRFVGCIVNLAALDAAIAVPPCCSTVAAAAFA